MGVDYAAFVAFGTPVSDEVYDRLWALIDENLGDPYEYMFRANEMGGTGGFFGVRGVSVEEGTYVAMSGEVVAGVDVEAFLAMARDYDVPTGGFGYYLVNQVY